MLCFKFIHSYHCITKKKRIYLKSDTSHVLKIRYTRHSHNSLHVQYVQYETEETISVLNENLFSEWKQNRKINYHGLAVWREVTVVAHLNLIKRENAYKNTLKHILFGWGTYNTVFEYLIYIMRTILLNYLLIWKRRRYYFNL